MASFPGLPGFLLPGTCHAKLCVRSRTIMVEVDAGRFMLGNHSVGFKNREEQPFERLAQRATADCRMRACSGSGGRRSRLHNLPLRMRSSTGRVTVSNTLG